MSVPVLGELRRAVEALPIGVTVTDLEGRIVYVNRAAAALHGWTARELEGQSSSILAPQDRAEPDGRALVARLTHWTREAVNRRRDGTTFVALLRSDILCDDTGQPVGIVTTCEDITERKAAEAQLEREAFHDPLTGLTNRTLLTRLLRTVLQRLDRPGEPSFAILFVDLDDFKVVNDTLGHHAGDRLLEQVAARLVTTLRPGDTIARFGGDEFVVLLDRLDRRGEAIRVARRILRSFEKQFVLLGHEIYVSASIGIALGASDDQDPEDIIRRADAAMYRAKAQGRGKFAVAEPVRTVPLAEQLSLLPLFRAVQDRPARTSS